MVDGARGGGNYSLQVKDGDISTTKLTPAQGGNAVQMLRFRVHNATNEAESASLAGISAETVSNWGGVLTFHTKPVNSLPNESLTERMRIDENGVTTFYGKVTAAPTEDSDPDNTVVTKGYLDGAVVLDQYLLKDFSSYPSITTARTVTAEAEPADSIEISPY